jgi:hypothetical protein
MLRRMAIVRSDVSGESIASVISVTRIGELGTMLAVVPNSPILVTLMMEAIRSSDTSNLTRATRHNISEDGILQLYLFLLSTNVSAARIIKYNVIRSAVAFQVERTHR